MPIPSIHPCVCNSVYKSGSASGLLRRPRRLLSPRVQRASTSRPRRSRSKERRASKERRTSRDSRASTTSTSRRDRRTPTRPHQSAVRRLEATYTDSDAEPSDSEIQREIGRLPKSQTPPQITRVFVIQNVCARDRRERTSDVKRQPSVPHWRWQLSRPPTSSRHDRLRRPRRMPPLLRRRRPLPKRRLLRQRWVHLRFLLVSSIQ